MASRTTRWPFSPRRPPRAITVSTAKVISPRPPRWNSTITSSWPNRVSSLAGSTSDMPVTVIDAVAVNRASQNVMPWWLAKGVANSAVPTAMRSKKPPLRMVGGL